MYQNWFTDASDVASQYAAAPASLIATTREFRDIMYSSSVPWQFTETAAGRLACMRSPTMWWTKEGFVLGNEGNQCCPLNCSHVYGYVTLLEKLYPDLAKDMRVSDFIRNYDPTNGCSMRFGSGGFAIDGSLANVIKTWLVVRQDDPEGKWLPTVWPYGNFGIVFRTVLVSHAPLGWLPTQTRAVRYMLFPVDLMLEFLFFFWPKLGMSRQ